MPARRATIYSVADQAQVSIATVSRVFQGSDKVAPATRERVLAAASSLDYTPDGAAKSLAAKRTHVLGLVLPEAKGSYYTELLTGFESAASEHGHSVMLLLGTDRLSKRLRQLEARVDGIAVMNGSGVVEAQSLEHVDNNLALVTIAAPAPEGGAAVATACRANAEALTRHILDHGRRKLRFVGDPDLAYDARHRYTGFGRALLAAGLPVPEPLRIPFDLDAAQPVAADLIAGRLNADALVCVNDEVALGLQYHLRQGGVRVGRDVALTGWDDVPAARLVQPGLTTVSQPVRELGRAAAIRLIERIQGGVTDAVPTQLLPTTLVVRGSCGCPEAPAAPRPLP